MRLSVRHETRYQYENGAAGAMMLLRLLPIDCQSQRVESWRVSVNDEPVETFSPNSFGVPEALWRTGQRVSDAIVVAEGVVETFDRAGIVGFTDELADIRIFLREGDYTVTTPALTALAAEARSDDGPLASMHNLSRIVHERLAYRADTTETSTTAAEALEMGVGVCQDFAHIFITCARALDVPARYVAGYVFDDEEPTENHRSHGWAECFIDGLGWIGFDPTRKICVTDQYVRLSWGVDAFDSALLRGVATLAGAISMQVDVLVAAAPLMSQSQSQQQ